MAPPAGPQGASAAATALCRRDALLGGTFELVELMVQAHPRPSWSTSGGAPPAQLIPKGVMSASAAGAMVRSVIRSRGGIGSEQRRVLACGPADERVGGRVHLVRRDHDDHGRGVPGPPG